MTATHTCSPICDREHPMTRDELNAIVKTLQPGDRVPPTETEPRPEHSTDADLTALIAEVERLRAKPTDAEVEAAENALILYGVEDLRRTVVAALKAAREVRNGHG